MIMRVPAGRPHLNQSPNPRGTQELKLLTTDRKLVNDTTVQVKLTSDEAKAAVTLKDKWTNGIIERKKPPLGLIFYS